MLHKPQVSAIGAAVFIAINAIGASAQAQQPAAQQMERVEVTGSRILSASALAAAPIQVMTAADIAASGAANLQDLLLKSPVFGTSSASNSLSRNNSNFLTSSSGVSTLDLRNLGIDRTLVLVNGRRYVSGIPGSSAVDLNTIPADFIERVEVLTGGASSTYGSDAVAGVVNIILKRNLQGLKLDAQVGQSSEGDDSKKKFSATVGSSAANGRANVMAHFAITRQGATFARDHGVPIDEQSAAVANPKTTNPADIFRPVRPNFSSFAPAGRFFGVDAQGKDLDFTFDANGKQIPWSSNGPAGDGVGATGFNRQAFRALSVPTDRLLLATKGDYQLSDAHQLFFEGTYASTKTKSEIEPFGLSSENVYAHNGGSVPSEFLIDGKTVRNPLVPANIVGDYSFYRRLTDLGSRIQNADRDTFRVVGGVKGELTSTWSYESFVGYGVTKEAQNGNGQVNVLNLRQALEAIPDGKGGVMCRDELARAQGCVPINVFGANTISAAAAKYVAAPQSLSTKVTQKMAGASVTGEPFEAPAGPVGFAFGAEWRKDASSALHDALTQTGQNGGNATPDTVGSFTVKEVFGEVRVPLLKSLPLVKTLDATAAYRHSDYSTIGTTKSWNTGLDWAANSTVRVRLTKALSTRAPNVGDLYAPRSQDFPQVSDPCDGKKSTDTDAVALACKAHPGVAANMAANNGVFTLTQPDKQGISGYNSGNPALKAEKGNSTTLGVVITPKDIPLLRNFAFTADYFDISIDKAINTPERAYLLQQCYGGGDTSFCKFITRRAVANAGGSAGALTFIDLVPVNSGGQIAKGVDFTASYAEQIAGGRLSARLAMTHLLKAERKATDTADANPTVGELGSPRNRWSLNLGYEYGPWGLTTTTSYIGESYLDDQFRKNYPQFSKADFKVKARTYLDLQGTYKLGRAQFYLGLDNALNTKAPPIITGLPGNTTGTATDAATYDPIGRRYYLGVRYSM